MSEKNYLIAGCDCGTGTLLSAKVNDKNKIEVNSIRDLFLMIDDNQISAAEMANSKLDYITQHDENGQIEFHAIVGEDALKFGNIFNTKVHRPMQKGMISQNELYAVPILTAMFKNIIGEEVTDGRVVFSIPSEPIDLDADEKSPLLFHSEIFKQIFREIGFKKVEALNEGMAVVYSELGKENYTGFGISVGAGQLNACLSYKGTQILAFSVGRSGDWVDNFAANSVGSIPNKIISIKERPDMNILNPISATTNKKEKLIRQAISFAFKNLIGYTVEHIVDYLKENEDKLDLDDIEFPIVIAGGTSLISGYIDVFNEKLNEYKKDLPINITEVRHSKNPLEAVSIGCLSYAKFLETQNK